MIDKIKFFLYAFVMFYGLSAASQALKVACIGNSITQGNMGGVYATTLQKLLGNGYYVQNYGVSGTTMLRAGDNPYWKNGKLNEVFAFRPDIVTIKLGTNDTKSYNWNGRAAQFKKDYELMIDTLATISSEPRIWIVIPVPIWSNSYGIQASVLQQMIPILWQIAFEKRLPLVDAYTPLLNFRQYFSDGVHPNQAGADTIAAVIYRALCGPPQILLSDTAVVCTVSTDSRSGTSETRYLSVCNTTRSPSLDSLTLAGEPAWLVVNRADVDRNHQRIGFAVDASKAPAMPGVYTDTVTLLAGNAEPPSRRITVKLVVKQGTAVRSSSIPIPLAAIATERPQTFVFYLEETLIRSRGKGLADLFDLQGKRCRTVIGNSGEKGRQNVLPPGVYMFCNRSGGK